MIYTIISRKAEIGETGKISIEGPFHIKVASRDIGDQPFLGFISEELAEEYMDAKNFLNEEYNVVPLKDLLNEKDRKKAVLVFETKYQFSDLENNPEGFNYESLIHENAL